MFENIQPGDYVRIDSWLPVTHVDGNDITVANSITLGRESVVAHKPQNKTPDDRWAMLTPEEKQMLINKL